MKRHLIKAAIILPGEPLSKVDPMKWKKAVKNIVAGGRREDLVLAFFTYAHNSYITESFLKRGLNSLGIDYIDVLLLGWFNKRPGRRIMDGALKLKQKGLVRHIGLSSHKRTLFPRLLQDENIDIFHIRYNAANIGAETDVFPHLNNKDKPGIVFFTATRWRQLLDPKKMPKDEKPPTATDCYRFVLSNPGVDVCMLGAKNLQQMRDNLTTLDKGSMNNEELARMRKNW